MRLRYAKRSETTEQIRFMNWCGYNQQRYPDLKWMHHIPNGGNRDEKEAKNLKQEGVKAGVSDLHLPVARGAYGSLYIEMKYGNNKLTEKQREFINDMLAAGNMAVVCYSAEAAMEITTKYLELNPHEQIVDSKLQCLVRFDRGILSLT